MTFQEALLCLNAVVGLGNRTITQLLKRYPNPADIFFCSSDDLVQSGCVFIHVAENIVHFDWQKFLDGENATLKEKGIQIITQQSVEYPEQLKEIPDAPIVLYAWGDSSLLKERAVAIVGSRRASIYGQGVAKRFALQLAESGVTINSGMALGIDAAAHEGALQASGKTVAVLGCGFNHVYPQRNKNLMRDIIEQGLVLSEFPLGMLPIAHNFPRRNRIVSGLSEAVLVVEAASRSGALITADFALEQGREVYAIPGSVDSPTSAGVHQLIKQGARLVTSWEEILDDLQILPEKGIFSPQELANTTNDAINRKLSGLEKEIYNLLEKKPRHIDELDGKCGNLQSSIAQTLLHLELKGLVKRQPGQIFEVKT